MSFDGGVERFSQAVRSHGGIENQLHWIWDVAFNEDDSRIRKDLALIRQVALNTFAVGNLSPSRGQSQTS